MTAEKKTLAHGLMPSTITSQDAKGLRRILKFVSLSSLSIFGLESKSVQNCNRKSEMKTLDVAEFSCFTKIH